MSEDGAARAQPRCPICESTLETRHCKYVCPQHGTIYDCSDPFS